MENKLEFSLDSQAVESLKMYSELLNKDIDVIMHEALEEYFYTQQQKLLEKNLANENAMTNLDYDEFWDGVDV